MATEFHYYPLLPTELQIKIWKLTLEQPRVIELGAAPKGWLYKDRAAQDVDDIYHRIMITSISSRATLVPTALETCLLSRTVALEFYAALSSGYSFFNPSIDTLFFGKEFDFTDGWEKWHRLVCNNSDIRHVAFDLATFRGRDDFHCMAKVARAQKERGITFVLEGTVETFEDQNRAGASTRYKSIEFRDIMANVSLRPAGKMFKEARTYLIRDSWATNEWHYRRLGQYPFDNSWEGPWKMPKIKFLLEDEHQARKARAERQVKQELAALRKAEEAALR